jgi:hypothetical protein
MQARQVARTAAVLATAFLPGMLVLLTYYEETGWFVLLAIFFLIASETSVRRCPRLFITIASVVLVHEIAAVYNIYGYPLLGAETDAHSFMEYAENRAVASIRPAISIDLYRNFLILLLSPSGKSLILAVSSSVLAFTLSLLIFNRLITLCGNERLRIPMLLLFGLMPHVLVYTSVTLREPLQLLFFIATIYYGIRFRTGHGFGSAFLFLLCATCLAILHQVLIPSALVLVAVILLWPAETWSPRKMLINLVATAVVVTTLAAATVHVMRREKFTGVGIVIKMAELDGDYFLRTIAGYRRAIENDTPRSSFNIQPDTSSFSALALSLPSLYLRYWFTPFPWQIENSADRVATLLALLRLGMMVVIIAGFCAASGGRRLNALFTTLFLLMCSTWILGTTNYGQAIRHQVLSDWLLILAAGTFLGRFLDTLSGSRQQPQAKGDHRNR